jgi:hypothetical protein
MKPRWWRNRSVKIVAAIILLAALYRAADWRAVGNVLISLDSRYLVAALALFLPQTLLSAWRWRMLVRPLRPIRFVEAIRHTAIASAWNLIVPSKLGDFSKAALVPHLTAKQRTTASGLVMLEKLTDVAALCALILLGVAAEQAVGAVVMAAVVGGSALAGEERPSIAARLRALPITPHQLAMLVASTFALWCLHLWQIELFLRSAGVVVPWNVAAARLPVAIFAGLLPLSFCGVGTRDAALVWLFADVAPASAMAAVGLLTALRYLVPGAAGIAVLAADRASGEDSVS